MSDDDRVVVIGSGPTGAVAAARLVERGVDVCMLDAGTHAPRGLLVKVAGNTIFRAASRSELAADRLDAASGADVEWHSSLSLGGLSNYWTAAVPRFAPSDFTEGALVDERYVWPVTYDELDPHYAYAERLLTVTSGPEPIPGVPPNITRYRTTVPPDWQQIIARGNEHGHALGMLPMAKGSPWMIARRAREFGSYHCVVAPMIGSPHFELRRGAHAVQLRWNARREQVDAVEYVDVASGARTVLPCRAVVVAAGAIDSTVLLLRSVSDHFPRGLGNNGGIVGRYLHDHPREWWMAHTTEPLRALAHPVYVAREPTEAATPLLATSLTLGLSSPVARLKTFVRGSVHSFGVQVFGTMVPTDSVGISLGTAGAAGSLDPHPHISIEFDDATVANLLSARERLRAVLADSGLAVDIPGPFHDVRPGSAVHYGGTVRMHRSPEHGALDGRGRLHEVANVVVADSSAFTTGPEKNPTLTAMALAGRAALLLADDLADGSLD